MDLDALAQKAAARKGTAGGIDLDALARKAQSRRATPEIDGANLYTNQNAGMFPQGSATDRVNALDPVAGDPTGITRVLDNVVGLDNGVMSPGEKAATLLNKAGESMTLGVVGDEAAAAVDSMIGRGQYDQRLAKYRADERQVSQENPALSFAADVAPAFLPGAGAAGALSKLGNIMGKAAAGGLAGAAAGGVYGFAEGEGGVAERAKNARNTALLGGVFGAAAPKVTDFAASVPGRLRRLFRQTATRPTISGLKATKNAAYKAVDDAGEAFDGDTMTALSERVKQSFAENNYVPETDNALTATIKLLDARAGKPTTLTQVDRLRQNLWKRYSNAKDQPQILDAIRAIDDMIETSGEASDLMKVARAANARYAKSQLLDDAFTKAADQTAGSGSGGNILNKYRQAVTSIINNEKKARFFSADEIDMMRKFVRGDLSENIKRRIGKLSPNGNGLMMSLHIIGGVASQGASLPLMAVGAAAKNSADKSAMRGAAQIQDYLAGVQAPVRPNTSGAALAVGSAPVAESLQSEVQNMLNQGQLVRR